MLTLAHVGLSIIQLLVVVGVFAILALMFSGRSDADTTAAAERRATRTMASPMACLATSSRSSAANTSRSAAWTPGSSDAPNPVDQSRSGL